MKKDWTKTPLTVLHRSYHDWLPLEKSLITHGLDCLTYDHPGFGRYLVLVGTFENHQVDAVLERPANYHVFHLAGWSRSRIPFPVPHNA